MSYEITFSGGFRITPHVTPEAIALFNDWLEETYWQVSEDGEELEPQEYCGGNNTGFEEDLEQCCKLLNAKGHRVTGTVVYGGEEVLWSDVGYIAITNETPIAEVTAHSFGTLEKVLLLLKAGRETLL